MKIALIDLDGTLTDSGPLILECARGALDELSLPPAPDSIVRGFLGPPLPVGARKILDVPEDQVQDFVDIYRRLYRERLTETPLFDGVMDVLRRLKEDGWTLAIATSKREDFAVRVLEQLGVAAEFAVISGGDLHDENAGKSWIIAQALERLQDQGIDTRIAVMVGDRIHDVEGAAAQGVPSVFVTWGYGALAEGDDADGVASDPSELPTVLAEIVERHYPAELSD